MISYAPCLYKEEESFVLTPPLPPAPSLVTAFPLSLRISPLAARPTPCHPDAQPRAGIVGLSANYTNAFFHSCAFKHGLLTTGVL